MTEQEQVRDKVRKMLEDAYRKGWDARGAAEQGVIDAALRRGYAQATTDFDGLLDTIAGEALGPNTVQAAEQAPDPEPEPSPPPEPEPELEPEPVREPEPQVPDSIDLMDGRILKGPGQIRALMWVVRDGGTWKDANAAAQEQDWKATALYRLRDLGLIHQDEGGRFFPTFPAKRAVERSLAKASGSP